MSDEKPTADDIMHALVAIHLATNEILLCMTKTLEQSGAMKSEDFEANLRALTARIAAEKSEHVASVMFDFADQLHRDERKVN